ncbi:MAG: gluconate 5-dehydrogenase, partial [Opitutaceae bacterium]|nr:gluconate 5-dehydrogenase [Opitutaceae bacterium]
MSTYLNELFGLTGKVAVVIGGTGELCGAMAAGLAGAGAEVVIVGRNAEKAAARIAQISA